MKDVIVRKRNYSVAAFFNFRSEVRNTWLCVCRKRREEAPEVNLRMSAENGWSCDQLRRGNDQIHTILWGLGP